MADDIKRKTELVVANELKNFVNKTDEELAAIGLSRADAETLASWKILVSRGGNDTDPAGAGDAKTQEPPFVIVEADEAVAQFSDEDTWRVLLNVGYISQVNDTQPAEHSANAQTLFRGLRAIRPGYDEGRAFRLHGIDVSGSNEFHDGNAAGDMIADIFGCAIGCSG